MKALNGIPASRGIAIGPAFQFKKTTIQIERLKVENPDQEIDRLASALQQARHEMSVLLEKARTETDAGTASIFEAHIMMLEDPDYLDAIREKIRGEALNAEAAVADATDTYAQMLEAMQDEYLRARAVDIRDVGSRVLRILLNLSSSPTEGLDQQAVILADELTPSDTISLDKNLVMGFCTAGGGPTAHVAILARQLGLPAVVSAGPEILDIPDMQPVIIDGSEGTLIIAPDAATIASKRLQMERQAAINDKALSQAKAPAITRDGQQIEIVANIGDVDSAVIALEAGAEGVGLLRTEFLYLKRTSMPDEEEQYQAYRKILEVFGSLPVILRTLDIGGDKELPYLNVPREANPFLGLRAIRLCLAKPEIFKPQLKAALRAGAGHNLKLMFPMVATVEEVRAARETMEECKAELLAKKQSIAEKLEVGIMVEIPAAAIIADKLAAEVDFFSIGTNDLSQYTMAADRTSGAVSKLADAFQPAVLRLVRDVVQAAHQNGKWVGMCGELAGEPLAIPLLLGLGLDELSMNASAIPLAKQILRASRLDKAKELAQTALELESSEAVKAFLETKNQSGH
ncbi:MAG: phosphoenolpyruvate--protein phosphotransferase [Anaerolineae bacterium UTCFX2]|jgi:phosphotransferase system enzyme I (PtsI)|nr:phosphoenolpyruvate--protein phosphotransferase [Anaerolineae bacterium]MCZ7552890.1 phosphoenolpyruvate--protein phosphotransferase [Anaerolineales bacterium]OQY91446.1 MAG: phosphoenolpyruvate--protein phosphotransferase [Anaerolineae bacterium UTCFX2]